MKSPCKVPPTTLEGRERETSVSFLIKAKCVAKGERALSRHTKNACVWQVGGGFRKSSAKGALNYCYAFHQPSDHTARVCTDVGITVAGSF